MMPARPHPTLRAQELAIINMIDGHVMSANELLG